MATQEIKGGRVPVLEFFDRHEEVTAWNLVEEFEVDSFLDHLMWNKIKRLEPASWGNPYHMSEPKVKRDP